MLQNIWSLARCCCVTRLQLQAHLYFVVLQMWLVMQQIALCTCHCLAILYQTSLPHVQAADASAQQQQPEEQLGAGQGAAADPQSQQQGQAKLDRGAAQPAQQGALPAAQHGQHGQHGQQQGHEEATFGFAKLRGAPGAAAAAPPAVGGAAAAAAATVDDALKRRVEDALRALKKDRKEKKEKRSRCAWLLCTAGFAASVCTPACLPAVQQQTLLLFSCLNPSSPGMLLVAARKKRSPSAKAAARRRAGSSTRRRAGTSAAAATAATATDPHQAEIPTEAAWMFMLTALARCCAKRLLSRRRHIQFVCEHGTLSFIFHYKCRCYSESGRRIRVQQHCR